MFEIYSKSVYELADKLPQWSSKDYYRRFNNAVASLLEEAGEISGLISKYRLRSKGDIDFYNTKFRDLPIDIQQTIKQKFIDEVSDELWVLTCTCYALGYKDSIDIPRIFKEAEEVYDYFDMELEQALFDVVSTIVTMNQNNLFEDCNIVFSLCEIVKYFGIFLAALNREYGISFDDLMKYNMNKLGLRYDENGKRVDGK